MIVTDILPFVKFDEISRLERFLLECPVFEVHSSILKRSTHDLNRPVSILSILCDDCFLTKTADLP